MSDLLKNTSLSLNTADKIISETLHKCDDGELYLEDTKFETVTPVSYTHLTLPTKRIV